MPKRKRHALPDLPPPQFKSLKISDNGVIDTSYSALIRYASHPDHKTLLECTEYFDAKLRHFKEGDKPFPDPPYEGRILEALIIQSRGQQRNPGNDCTKCSNGNGLFIGCNKMKGWFNGVCGNCKRGDEGAHCEVRDKPKEAFRAPTPPPMEEITTRSGRTTRVPVSYAPVDARKKTWNVYIPRTLQRSPTPEALSDNEA